MENLKKNSNNYYLHTIVIIFLSLVLIFLIYLLGGNILGNVILDPNSIGFNGESRSSNYEELVNNIFENSNVISIIDENILWVPWFTTSSSCDEQMLHQNFSCNIGNVNFTQNCMVSDEFSQVGILAALSSNQTRMNYFYNTLLQINSSFGVLASWRSYRNGSDIVACGKEVNENCDSASDADARIIIALFTASNNSLFSDEDKKEEYASLARSYAEDFVKYEIVNECYPSGTDYGPICYWLASGSIAKNAGISSNDFAYTGYYSDSVIAMLAACAQTNNITYCNIANNLSLNYLVASKFNNSSFSVPPGRSFKWVNLSGIPVAECTNTCDPIQWDNSDAPRALGICQAPYYAMLMNMTLSGLNDYCNIWRNTYLNDTTKIPYQYLEDGAPAHSFQTGYFAQGLQSLAQFATDSYILIIDNAISHYDFETGKWDNLNCSGVYTTSIAIRSLGSGIGRDKASFMVNINYENLSYVQNETNNTKEIMAPESNSNSAGRGSSSENKNDYIIIEKESNEEIINESGIFLTTYEENEYFQINESNKNLENEQKYISYSNYYNWIIIFIVIIIFIFLILLIIIKYKFN